MRWREVVEPWEARARALRTEAYALYLAYRDPRVPWHARAFAACVVAYAFSPLDLVPDFIPILGYLDDLVLVPVGVTLALRMMPEGVLEEHRQAAREALAEGKPTNWGGAAVVIAIWLLLVGWVAITAWRWLRGL